MVTFEGDNTVMLIQSTRFLKKLYKRVQSGETINSQTFSYLNHIDANIKKVCAAQTPEDFCSIDQVIEALEVAASYEIHSTYQLMRQSKVPEKVKENDIFALDLLKMAKSHLYAVAANIAKHTANQPKCPNLRRHQGNMCILYCLTNLSQDTSSLYESGYFQSACGQLLDTAIKLTLKALRPQIIPLAEVVDHSDNSLMSAIGNSYGDIYETHLEWAKTSRLNNPANGSIPDGYIEHIMPIL